MCKNKLQMACIRRIAKEAGAERISKDAANEINDAVSHYCKYLAKRSNKFAKHACRKTVRPADVELAKITKFL